MTISTKECEELFTQKRCASLFPKTRSDDFFEALFGDAAEGAYDIELAFRAISDSQLDMELRLNQRPGCCLACNLTQGLPQVFSRHPIININGLVAAIDTLLEEKATCKSWKLSATEQLSQALHIVPLHIELA